MNPATAKRLALLASAASVLLVLAVLASAWIYWRVRASLPQLDGSGSVAGLSATVTVERDAQGVPTVRAHNRLDVARALGWLHGQDRFFQMDLLRRAPAGELAELFGKRVLHRDRAARMHGFRTLARTVLSRLPPGERAIVEAYTVGVNAGLGALPERPFEYLILRDQPQPWRPEDSILVIYSMTMDLQDEQGGYERSLMTLRDQLGLDAVAFFAPVVTPTDAALDGTTGPLAEMPGPATIDLRKKKVGFSQVALPPAADPFPFFARDPEAIRGSNAFVLAGAHTASGGAMLANDMHLDHGVPNTWYRAVLEWSSETSDATEQGPGSTRRVVGVTLPGTPVVVAGSNGHVAWGFTASYIDVGDLVVVETDSIADTLYRAPERDGLVPIETRTDTLHVKGEDSVAVQYSWTVWGPIVGRNDRNRPLAHRWTAHDPEATNLTLLEMERATTVKEAIAVAHRAGIPAQNILIADKAGDVAWTIAGRVPKRVGYDGRLPVAWTFGDRRWDGYLAPQDVPVVTHRSGGVPAGPVAREGRLWSANHRHVGGESLAKLGDGGYRRAARASQIRDGIATLSRATPRDLLAVQLDDRALFLERWHALMMETLTPAVIAGNKPRTALRSFAEPWEGRATVDAVSYLLVREFRAAIYAHVFTPIFESCVEAYPGFDYRNFQLEGALWEMLRQKPMHLLNPRFASWNDLLVHAADDVIKVVDKQGVTLPQGNWGRRNRARIRHPFSSASPWLANWYNMPADPLPGGEDMPRVQSPSHGASERMVVSPGREEDGIFHMPGGQSAHPMSPFFRAGHDAWVRGEPTPLLPGKREHILRLTPAP